MEYKKPLPIIDGESRPFWEGCAQGKLMIQRCEDCGKHIFYPRIVCPHCFSDRVQWVESKGTGTIYSFTVARRPGAPGFENDVPYVVALIDLDEGVRMMSTVTDVDVEKVKVGQRVKVWFDKVTDELTLPKFRLVES